VKDLDHGVEYRKKKRTNIGASQNFHGKNGFVVTLKAKPILHRRWEKEKVVCSRHRKVGGTGRRATFRKPTRQGVGGKRTMASQTGGKENQACGQYNVSRRNQEPRGFFKTGKPATKAFWGRDINRNPPKKILVWTLKKKVVLLRKRGGGTWGKSIDFGGEHLHNFRGV